MDETTGDWDASDEASVERWARWFAFMDRHPWVMRFVPPRWK